ncbi:MAG: putative lipid II flippase FtsW [candidate division NC10 bacterium]|nr:putative lipid II flippase FtsW [candidate division NC10 bacterium]
MVEATLPTAGPGPATTDLGRRPRGWRALLPARAEGGSVSSVDQILLVGVLLLVALGIVMIYSSSAIRAQERFADPAYFLKRQLMWSVVALLAMSVAIFLDLKTLQRLTPILFLGSLLLLMLVLIPGVGAKVNGARRWIRILGVLNFQPAELAKIALVMFLASYFARRQDRLDSYLDGFLPPLLMTGLMAGLIIAQPNFGTVGVLLFVAGVVFFVGGAHLGHMAATAAAALPILAYLIYRSPHGWDRILILWDPSRASAKVTYHMDQSFNALGQGGLFGLGLGNSMQKLFFLPEPHNDFIFAILGEELGFVGALAVVGLFLVILWRGTRAALRAQEPFASYLAVGLTALVVGQGVLNMGVVSGLLPTTGIPLPFLSFGGSSLTFMLFGVGILLNISRHSR